MDDQIVNDDAQVSDDQTLGESQADATRDAQAEPATQQTTVEPDATADATVDRIRQDNAALRATLIKLGVDPDSSDAENLRNGYVSVDEFVNAKFGRDKPPQPASAQPELTLVEKIQKLRTAVSSVDGAVSVDDYKQQLLTAVEVIGHIAEDNNIVRSERQQDQTQRVLDNCMNACRTTYQSHGSFKSLAPEAQVKAASFIESATDMRVGQLAQQIGFDNAAKPQIYQNETAKVLQEFSSLVQAISGKAAPSPQPQGMAHVAPQVMGSGPAQPISTPKPKMDLNDLSTNVDRYLASVAGRV